MKKTSIAVLALAVIFIVSFSGCNGRDYTEYDDVIELPDEPRMLELDEIVIIRSDDLYYRIDGNEIVDEIILDVAYHVMGIHGAYYFTPGGWTDEFIKEMVLVTEEGVKFAKDFLGIEVNSPLSFIFNVTEPDENHPLPMMWRGGGVWGTSTYISMPADLMPTIIVHEAAHAILQYDGRRSNFPYSPETSPEHGVPWLEEGLCDVVDFLFFMQTERRYRINFLDNRESAENHFHRLALDFFRFFNNFEDESRFGTRYPQLMNTFTSASFIYYLLTYHGSIEDFMRVFDDIYLMEEVYGLSMYDMIVQWMEYLEQFR